MKLSDCVAALELIEGIDAETAQQRVERAATEATERFPATIYGAGGYHRFALYRRGQQFDFRLMQWSLCGLGSEDRKTLSQCEAIGVAVQ